MAFGAVLDTCVLYPFSLCDLLLRLAERELYDAYWSGRILTELERNLVNQRLTTEQAGRRVGAMRQAFPAAEVSARAIAGLERQMTNERKDRHVLAAAVASSADAIVTFNVRHFAAGACDPYQVEVLHPDRFLVGLHDRDREMVESAIGAQAAALRRPPTSRAELLEMLERAGVPEFVARVRPSRSAGDR